MSNKNIQSCNSCKADNVTGDTSWVRSFGAFNGAPNPSLQTPPQGQTMAPNLAWPVIVDLCPSCAAKTTIAQLSELSSKPEAKLIAGAPVWKLPITAKTEAK